MDSGKMLDYTDLKLNRYVPVEEFPAIVKINESLNSLHARVGELGRIVSELRDHIETMQDEIDTIYETETEENYS